MRSTLPTISINLLFPKCHNVRRRVAQTKGPWLPLERRGVHGDTIVVIENNSWVDSSYATVSWLGRTGNEPSGKSDSAQRPVSVHLTRSPISMESRVRQRLHRLPGYSHSQRARRHWVEQSHGIQYQESYGNS